MKTLKITFAPATTRAEAIVLVEQNQEWMNEYLVQSAQWAKGIKSAGRKARTISHNIVRNASTVNQAMIMADKEVKQKSKKQMTNKK